MRRFFSFLKLKAVMESKELSAADFSRKTGIPEATLSRWSDAKTRPSDIPFSTAVACAEGCGVPLGNLVESHDPDWRWYAYDQHAEISRLFDDIPGKSHATFTTCSRDLHTFHVPDEMMEERKRRDLSGLPESQVESRLAWCRATAKKRRLERDKGNYTHRIIAAEPILRWARRRDAGWLDGIKGEEERHPLDTALGFLDAKAWNAFHTEVGESIDLPHWEHIYVGEGIAAFVWTKKGIWFTSADSAVQELLAAIDRAALKCFSHYFPTREEITASGFRDAYRSFLNTWDDLFHPRKSTKLTSSHVVK